MTLEAEASSPGLTPLGEAERIESVDVLRGVAVLGILGMNVYAFGLPWAAYSNPLNGGGTGGLDLAAWWLTHLLFEMKFMSIFSVLFGAGLAVMSERAARRGRPLAAVYYRRVLWLMLFGLIHGYLLWFGDILFSYALCGLLLYPLRRLDPRVMLVLGTTLILLAMPIGLPVGYALLPQVEADARQALAAKQAGEQPTEEQLRALETWQNISPTPERLAEEIEVYRNGYLRQVAFRAPLVLKFQTAFMLLWGLWRIGGLMVIGLALMRLGILSAARPTSFYLACCVVGYVVGLPLTYLGGRGLFAHHFDALYFNQGGWVPNYVGSLFVATGHVGLVMLACKARLLPAALRRLRAVGRMALTHYLAQTLICTFVFYGWGLGLFGHLGRAALVAVACSVWVLELAVSVAWLRHFRSGPAEWLWRSLTYGRALPLRREAVTG